MIQDSGYFSQIFDEIKTAITFDWIELERRSLTIFHSKFDALQLFINEVVQFRNYLKNLIFSASFLKKYVVGTSGDLTQNLVENDPLPLGYPKIPQLVLEQIVPI